MTQIYFDRAYSLSVGQNGAAGGKLITSHDTPPELRVVFEVVKTTSDNPNQSKISVYNLNPTTRAMLEKPDIVVNMAAGYKKNGGAQLMYSGNVIFGYSRREGPEIVTELQLADGHTALRDTMLTMAIRSGGKAKDAVKQIARAFDMPLHMASDTVDRAWQHGYSYSGLAKTALRQICLATGLEWSVQNGVLQVINAGGNTGRLAISISPDTGLIRSPERLREGSQVAAAVVDQDTPSSAKDVKYLTGMRLRFNGWRITTVLLPMVNPGDLLALTSEAISGTFRVDNIRHQGDSHGNEWVSHIELLSPDDWNVRQAAATLKASKQAVANARAQARALKNVGG